MVVQVVSRIMVMVCARSRAAYSDTTSEECGKEGLNEVLEPYPSWTGVGLPHQPELGYARGAKTIGAEGKRKYSRREVKVVESKFERYVERGRGWSLQIGHELIVVLHARV